MGDPTGSHLTRRVSVTIEEYLLDDPVILIEGPRSVGKSTLLQEVAAAHGARVVDLDNPLTRDEVARDPLGFVSDSPLVCIDEYQKAPIILDAIKTELNRDGRAGRFILAGSARHDSLPAAAQALTGRLSRIPLHPFSVLEIKEVTGSGVAEILDSPVDFFSLRRDSATEREEYLNLVITGGFPAALTSNSINARNRWFDQYTRLTLERDVSDLRRLRQNSHLRQLVRQLAARTGQLLVLEKAAREAEIDRKTAENYLELLEAVFLVHRLPAWGKTLNSRVGQSPKIHLLDSGVAARLLRVNPQNLAHRTPASLTQLGHLLETFAVNEILKQLSWISEQVLPGHWRTHRGDEVDLVLEREDGSIIGFEIKTSGRILPTDFSGLRALRALVGPAFAAGFVLYLGPRSYQHDDQLFVVPVDRLWS